MRIVNIECGIAAAFAVLIAIASPPEREGAAPRGLRTLPPIQSAPAGVSGTTGALCYAQHSAHRETAADVGRVE